MSSSNSSQESEQEIDLRIARIKNELAEAEARLKNEIAEILARLKKELAEVEAPLKKELAEAELQRGYIRAAARQKEILKGLLEQKPRAWLASSELVQEGDTTPDQWLAWPSNPLFSKSSRIFEVCEAARNTDGIAANPLNDSPLDIWM